MAAKKRVTAEKKPYTQPAIRPVSKEEAEHIAGAPDGPSAFSPPYAHPPGESVGTLRITVVSIKGDVDVATAGKLGELVGKLLGR